MRICFRIALLLIPIFFVCNAYSAIEHFTVELNQRGSTGGFIFFEYDDDNGGPNRGFLRIEINMTRSQYVDDSFQGLGLSDLGTQNYGPGGPGAVLLYDILRNEQSGMLTHTLATSEFTPATLGFQLLFVGPGAPIGWSTSHGNQDCVASAGRLQFGFCSGINGSGGVAFGGRYEDVDITIPTDPVPPPVTVPSYERSDVTLAELDDRVGYAVAIKDDWVFVSAAYDEDPQNSGKVMVFQKDVSGNLTLFTTLKPTDLARHNQFGSALAVQGHTLMVGARNQSVNSFMDGTVYVYEFDDFGNFTQTQKLQAQSNDRVIGLGMSIELTAQYMVIGAERTFTDGLVYSGAAYVVENVDGQWTQVAELLPPNPQSKGFFGYDVAINETGTQIIVGEPESSSYATKGGVAHVYELTNGQWAYRKQLRPTEAMDRQFFGYSVAATEHYIAVGAPNDAEMATAAGAVYVYQNLAGAVVFSEKVFATDPSNYTYGRFGANTVFHANALWVGAETRHATGALFRLYRQNGNWLTHTVYRDPGSLSLDKFARTFDIDNGFAIVGSPEADDAGTLSGAFTLIELEP